MNCSKAQYIIERSQGRATRFSHCCLQSMTLYNKSWQGNIVLQQRVDKATWRIIVRSKTSRILIHVIPLKWSLLLWMKNLLRFVILPDLRFHQTTRLSDIWLNMHSVDDNNWLDWKKHRLQRYIGEKNYVRKVGSQKTTKIDIYVTSNRCICQKKMPLEKVDKSNKNWLRWKNQLPFTSAKVNKPSVITFGERP